MKAIKKWLFYLCIFSDLHFKFIFRGILFPENKKNWIKFCLRIAPIHAHESACEIVFVCVCVMRPTYTFSRMVWFWFSVLCTKAKLCWSLFSSSLLFSFGHETLTLISKEKKFSLTKSFIYLKFSYVVDFKTKDIGFYFDSVSYIFWD